MTPSAIFINILVFISASWYLFTTGHYFPALLGYLFVIVYMFDEKFYLISDILAAIALLSIIFFFFKDYYFVDTSGDAMSFGSGIIYMFVIYFKLRAIFDPD